VVRVNVTVAFRCRVWFIALRAV